MRFLSFQFCLLCWNWKLRNTEILLKLVNFIAVVFLQGVGNLWCFQVFGFGSYNEIENFENCKKLWRLKSLSAVVSLKKVRNFWHFWMFDFCPYTETKNLENSKVINFWSFWIFDFGRYTETKKLENCIKFFHVFQNSKQLFDLFKTHKSLKKFPSFCSFIFQHQC